MSKKPRGIAAKDVQTIFDDACIRQLAKIARLPKVADQQKFKDGIQAAACIYARDSRIPDGNDVHSEIRALLRAAEKREYEKLATLIEAITPRTADLLNRRGALPSRGMSVPSAGALRDVAKQAVACEAIATLCRVGGVLIEGRCRPSGKKSRTWKPLIHAPDPRRHFSKRDAERQFVIWLRAAWLDATGKLPSRTASHAANRLGPFALFVRECLALVGATHTDAVNLINETNRKHLDGS